MLILDMQDTRSPLPSQHALDWLNFFLAALLMGFGPFVAVHLAEQGWEPASIGVALSISGLALYGIIVAAESWAVYWQPPPEVVGVGGG